MSNKKVLSVALIFGLLAALAVNSYLKSIKDSITNAQVGKVVIANMLIPARTLVTADMLTIKSIPVQYIHDRAVTDPSKVVGFASRSDIEEGEQVLQTKLVAREGTGTTLAYSIPMGMRAISITVDEQTGLSGLVAPGDRVDVMGTADIEEQSKDPSINTVKHTVTHLILQNIEVLAVGQSFAKPINETTGKKDSEKAPEPKKANAGTVTLAVPTEKMQFLVAVSDKGKLTLALRSPTDKSEEDRPVIDSLALLR